MSPATVARRRYGDCKDLAWLATCILRSWGVSARPILVGSGLRRRVESLLPATTLFNHAVVEVDLGGQPRWFDLTIRAQGGDFVQRPIPWFGFGLPVEAQAGALISQPGIRSSATYAIRETIYLDTRKGNPSQVELRLRVSGWQADHFRRSRLTQGADEFAKERLKHVQHRYHKATRPAPLLWRDSRELNVCEIVETFEFTDAAITDEGGGRVIYDVPPNIVIQSFGLPEEQPRRAPWDLPYPLEIRHDIRIHAAGMGIGPRQRRRWTPPEFTGLLDEPRDEGNWAKTVRFIVQADDVSIDRISEYRSVLDRFLSATSWRLYLPKDRERPAPAQPLGALPPPDDGEKGYVPGADPVDFNDVTASPVEAAPRVGTLGKKPFLSFGGTGSFRGIPVVAWVMLVIFLSTIAHSCSEMSAPRPLAQDHPANSALFSGPADTYATPEQPQPIGPADFTQSQPVITHTVFPAYPNAVRQAKIEGTVVLHFTVDTFGNVINPTVGSSPSPVLSDLALDAAKKWKFRPGKKGGKPIPFSVEVPVEFNADSPGGEEQFSIDQPLKDALNHP